MPLEFLYVQSDVPVGFYLKDILAGYPFALDYLAVSPKSAGIRYYCGEIWGHLPVFFFSFVIDLVIYMTAQIVLPLVNPETSLG